MEKKRHTDKENNLNNEAVFRAGSKKSQKNIIISTLIVVALALFAHAVISNTADEQYPDKEVYEVADLERLRLTGTNDDIYRAANSLLNNEALNEGDRAKVLIDLGDTYRNDNRLEDAIEVYREAINLLGSEATNIQYTRLAAAYEDSSEYSLAIEYYQKALDNFAEADDPFAGEEKDRIKGNISLLEELKDEQ